ncbi:MAG: STAS domain-containing protein [Pirellula sp.]|jgi:anti-sigma B factor antagonist|nr:STAS domain-containing protein [Pirellula sp.]
MYHCKRSGAVDIVSGNSPLIQEHRTEFLKSIDSCIGNGQPRVILDLSGVALMDSVGLDALMDARDRCQSLGGSFVLAHPNPLCRDILRINGIDREINVYDDVVRALGSFAR